MNKLKKTQLVDLPPSNDVKGSQLNLTMTDKSVVQVILPLGGTQLSLSKAFEAAAAELSKAHSDVMLSEFLKDTKHGNDLTRNKCILLIHDQETLDDLNAADPYFNWNIKLMEYLLDTVVIATVVSPSEFRVEDTNGEERHWWIVPSKMATVLVTPESHPELYETE